MCIEWPTRTTVPMCVFVRQMYFTFIKPMQYWPMMIRWHHIKQIRMSSIKNVGVREHSILALSDLIIVTIFSMIYTSKLSTKLIIRCTNTIGIWCLLIWTDTNEHDDERIFGERIWKKWKHGTGKTKFNVIRSLIWCKIQSGIAFTFFFLSISYDIHTIKFTCWNLLKSIETSFAISQLICINNNNDNKIDGNQK